MPTLIERARRFVAARVLGPEQARLDETVNLFWAAYQAGPWEMTPADLMTRLQEIDPALISDALWQLGWEDASTWTEDTSAERERAVKGAVRLYKYSPLAQWAVWLWSMWGLGENVEVTPTDSGAAEVWAEFWTAKRNRRLLGADTIQELSNWLLVKGNRFLAFYASEQDGEATVRAVNPDEIKAVITNPDDSTEPWFYKREWVPQTELSATGTMRTLYYPDWETFFSEELDARWNQVVEEYSLGEAAERADQVMAGEEDGAPGTVVCMLHIPINCKDETSLWGWPILTTARTYIRGHKQFAEARLAVAMAKAAYVRRKKVTGGSRAVTAVTDSIRSHLSSTQTTETQQPPVAGSTEVENAMIDTRDLPMTTGAADARTDNAMFSWMALLGAGLFPTSAGLDTSRWATAVEMDKAQSMLFKGYQTFWSTQFQLMVEIVLSFAEKYGNKTFKDKSATVSIDSFSLADFPAVADAIGKIAVNALTPAVEKGYIPREAANEVGKALWLVVLQSLGIITEDLKEDTLWELPEEEPAPAPPAGGDGDGDAPPRPEEEAPSAGVPAEAVRQASRNLAEGSIDPRQVAIWALEVLADQE